MPKSPKDRFNSTWDLSVYMQEILEIVSLALLISQLLENSILFQVFVKGLLRRRFGRRQSAEGVHGWKEVRVLGGSEV
jgi:hypothetical protein